MGHITKTYLSYYQVKNGVKKEKGEEKSEEREKRRMEGTKKKKE